LVQQVQTLEAEVDESRRERDQAREVLHPHLCADITESVKCVFVVGVLVRLLNTVLLRKLARRV
jgi:hypothetical protein